MRKSQQTYSVLLGFTFLLLLLAPVVKAQQSFYDFSVKSIDGVEFDLGQCRGKKVLVVNTASGCALTPQYEGLEELYKKYGGEDFVILAFPSNDFGHQEPGSNKEIAAFCSTEYNITFPVMAKITVKGEDMHPLYNWLTKASENGVEDSKVTWNFQKFMIDETGTLVGNVSPIKKPDSKTITSWITTK